MPETYYQNGGEPAKYKHTGRFNVRPGRKARGRGRGQKNRLRKSAVWAKKLYRRKTKQEILRF